MGQTGKLVAMGMLLWSGCVGGTFDRVPGQDRAEQIVWHDLYGEDSDPPPVEWFHGDGYLPGATGATGLTLPGWKVQVGYRQTTCPAGVYSTEPFDCSVSGGSLAHEFMHYRTALRTGDVDAAHNRGDWHLADDVAFQALINSRL
jgi:hypothetical protein